MQLVSLQILYFLQADEEQIMSETSFLPHEWTITGYASFFLPQVISDRTMDITKTLQ